jgi:threonine/homoserine/homoserine lactone efflux protein
VPDAQQLLIFIAAAVVLIITPGPDILFMLACTMRGGLRAGWLGLFGVCTGCLVHATLASLGVAGLLAAFPAVFNVLRLVGAGYLLYLGLTILLKRRSQAGASESADTGEKAALAEDNARAYFARGFASNILNPKASMFYLAFLPQFVNPDGNAVLQSFLLGSLHIVLSLLICGVMVWFAAKAHSRLKGLTESPWLKRWLPGAVFCGLGLRLALDRRL